MNKKRLISDSIDARNYRFLIKLEATLFVAYVLIFSFVFTIIFWNMMDIAYLALIIAISLFLIIHIPMLLSDIYHLWKITARSNKYIFAHTVLSNPIYKSLGGFYFSVNVQDEIGNIHTGETAAIYTTIKNPYLEEWKDKKVLAAYDPETQKVFVIGLKKDFPDIPAN